MKLADLAGSVKMPARLMPGIHRLQAISRVPDNTILQRVVKIVGSLHSCDLSL
jgi:hypothetical protein